jgi:adenylate cyclase
MAETRKLAAILAADIVGYSRLAGADEDRTLARLRALRSDLIDPTTAVHHGRVVKRTGDGALVEFRSVVDAVRCAIEVHNGITLRVIHVISKLHKALPIYASNGCQIAASRQPSLKPTT